MKTLRTILSIFSLSIILLSSCSEKEDFIEFEKFDNIQLNTQTANNDGNGNYIDPNSEDKTE